MNAVLESLAKIRPIFHSEADFQLAFAWQLQHLYPEARIRLEYRVRIPKSSDSLGESYCIDAWVRLPDETIAIELKYLTRQMTTEVNGEEFSLTNQAAQNLRSYDVIKDIVRLERVAGHFPRVRGVACVLTNDSSYLNESSSVSTDLIPEKRRSFARDAFRINQGRILTGELAWPAGPRDYGARDKPLNVKGAYTLDWFKYAKVGQHKAGQFYGLIIEVSAEEKTTYPSPPTGSGI